MPSLAQAGKVKTRTPIWGRWIDRARAHLWPFVTQLFAQEILRDFYAAIFGRPVDAAGVAAYIKKPGGLRDQRAVLHSLIHSREFQRKAFALLAPEDLGFPASEIAQAFYHGVLGREANPEELAAFTQQLAQSKNLGGAVAGLLNSDKFQRGIFASLAPDIVQSLYGWILGRQADPAGLKIYSERLAANFKVDSVMSELFQSEEYRQKSFATLSRPLLEGLYKGVLNRDLDPVGWNTYRRVLAHTGDVSTILTKLIGSLEFRRNYAAAQSVARARTRAMAFDGTCWVFIHIAKTGGSSVQQLLADSFPPEKVYKEHDDTLPQHKPETLRPYSVFAGHFNHDSLAFVPRKSISFLTFLREPVDRLCSYYNFLRAHEPGNVMYARFHQAANELDFESFFHKDEITASQDIWNHMTWAIMGARQWEAWQLHFLRSPDAASTAEFIDTVARPAIRRRLQEFSFIGLQEDFDRSVTMLCHLLGVPSPEVVPTQNRLADLMISGVGYKKDLKPEPITPARRQLLDNLVQLDQVVYEEAKVIYSQQQAGAGRPSAPSVSMPSPSNPPIPVPYAGNLATGNAIGEAPSAFLAQS